MISIWGMATLILLFQFTNLSNTLELIKLLFYSFLLAIFILPLILKVYFSFFHIYVRDERLTEKEDRKGAKIYFFIVVMLSSIGTCSYINIKYSNFEIIRWYTVIDKEHIGKENYIWIYINKTPYKVNVGYKIYRKYHIQNKIPIRHVSGLFNVEVIIPVEN